MRFLALILIVAPWHLLSRLFTHASLNKKLPAKSARLPPRLTLPLLHPWAPQVKDLESQIAFHQAKLNELKLELAAKSAIACKNLLGEEIHDPEAAQEALNDSALVDQVCNLLNPCVRAWKHQHAHTGTTGKKRVRVGVSARPCNCNSMYSRYGFSCFVSVLHACSSRSRAVPDLGLPIRRQYSRTWAAHFYSLTPVSGPSTLPLRAAGEPVSRR